MLEITTHSLVKNEDRWIWFALNSWAPFAKSMIVFDDSSTDATPKIIKEMNLPHLTYQKISTKSPEDLVVARAKMKAQTLTNWFVLLDGDEVWDNKTVERFIDHISKVRTNVDMVALRTRNCIGDAYHYLPESAGQYEILGQKGHFNIRAYRNKKNYSWQGIYPLEYYGDETGHALLEKRNSISLFDGFYWHMTHLQRSSNKDAVFGWRHVKHELGIPVGSASKFPEVFYTPRPKEVADPWKRRGVVHTLFSSVITPIKNIKRKAVQWQQIH